MRATGLAGKLPPLAPRGVPAVWERSSFQRNSDWPLGLLPPRHAWGAPPGTRLEDILIKRLNPPLKSFILFF